MAMPQHQFQQQQQQHQQQTSQLRNLPTIDQGFPQYIHPFHVPGFAPAPVFPSDAFDGGWSNDVEIPNKRLKEEDFLQSRSVSTGLGLSLDDNRLVSSGEYPVLSLFNGEIDRELQRQDAEIDRFFKVEGERLRHSILEKFQANQLQTIAIAEGRILQKLREKEAEVDGVNKKNLELEEQMRQKMAEVVAWQKQAKHNENMITNLKFHLQQILVNNRDSKEGCGDSEDDTASCCNIGDTDFNIIGKENKNLKQPTTCKICGVNQVCMLLLPCRHLCLCKDCDRKYGFCPLCQTPKVVAMEIFM